MRCFTSSKIFFNKTVVEFTIRFISRMPRAAMPPKKRKAKANGYEFPDPLPLGEILKDVSKKEWLLGPSIGKGGFGEIYSACEAEAKTKTKTYPYAIKVEPHANGPLFVERAFYIKVCKPDKLEEWKKKKGLKLLGVPSLQGFGSHMHNNKNYRFVIMDRFGRDLWSTFLENNKLLSATSTFNFAIQILDALEYIHSTGYVHCDIKAANLLYGYAKGTENNLFLVDFGLVCRFSVEKEFKKDPKKAHNGTIEYTSRDLHQGVATRRGDLEILGYNLLHWLHSSLPWEKNLTDPEAVFQSKSDMMSSINTKLRKFAPNIPSVITDYLDYVSKMDHLEEPDYEKCRHMFHEALKQAPKDSKSATPGKVQGRSTSVKSPKKRMRPGSSKRSVNRLQDDSEPGNKENNLEDDTSNNDAVLPVKKSKTAVKANWRQAPMCEPGVIVTSQDKKRNKSNNQLKTSEKPAKTGPKPSWKDCPTIKASNIVIAGQYSSTRSTKK